MTLQIGKTYILRINVNNRTLTYEGKIISCNNIEFKFIDKFDDEWTYKHSVLIGYKQINNGETK